MLIDLVSLFSSLFFAGVTSSPRTTTPGSVGGIFLMAKQLGQHGLHGMTERLAPTTSPPNVKEWSLRAWRMKEQLDQAQTTLALLHRPLVLKVLCLKLRMICSEKKMTNWNENWRNKNKHFHSVKYPHTLTKFITTLAWQMLPLSSFWKPFSPNLISSTTLIGMSKLCLLSISYSWLRWSSDWIVAS